MEVNMFDEITFFTIFSTTISFENEDDEDEDAQAFVDDEEEEEGVLCLTSMDLSFFLFSPRLSVDCVYIFKDVFSDAAKALFWISFLECNSIRKTALPQKVSQRQISDRTALRVESIFPGFTNYNQD